MRELASDKILIGIPALDERENIENLVREIDQTYPQFHLLIIDDSSDKNFLANSPLLKSKKNLTLIQRGRRLGIGSAHQFMLGYARINQYSILITMDGDGTHRVRDLALIVSTIKDCDMVIASRFLEGGGLSSWPFVRKLTTYSAHFLTSFSTNTNLDCTSGFRAYNLAESTFRFLESDLPTDYRFLYRSAFEALLQTKKIKECPAMLERRALGESKMNLKSAFNLILGLMADCVLFKSRKLKSNSNHHDQTSTK